MECVCKGKKTVFERQDDITDQRDEIWDGNDRRAIQKVRQTVLKDMIGKMYSKIKEPKRKPKIGSSTAKASRGGAETRRFDGFSDGIGIYALDVRKDVLHQLGEG